VQSSCIYWLWNAADPGQHRQLKVRLPVYVGSEPRERPLCAPQHYFGGGAARPLKGGVQAAAGVTRLMHQCTAMLRERMCDELRTPPAAPPVRCAHPQATGAERRPWTTSGAAPAGSPPLSGLAQRATGRAMPADGKFAGAPSACSAGRRYQGAPSVSPDNALEAMGPVLESVLGSLTQARPRLATPLLPSRHAAPARQGLRDAGGQA